MAAARRPPPRYDRTAGWSSAIPRRGRFLVRSGPLTGRLGAPADAGPVSANFRAAAVALGADGTAAAVWESTTYSLPWRLRAAVRPAGRARFARYAELGAAEARPGTLLAGAAPVARVGSRGAVTVGFSEPDADRSMCATATPAGRFAAPRQVASAISGILSDVPTIVFGPAAAAAAVSSALTPDESTILSTLVSRRPRLPGRGHDGDRSRRRPARRRDARRARSDLGARPAHIVGQLTLAAAADDRRRGGLSRYAPSFGDCHGAASRAASVSGSSSIATRSCASVSRSRTVTVRSSSVWWSTVTQNGVPISSWRR